MATTSATSVVADGPPTDEGSTDAVWTHWPAAQRPGRTALLGFLVAGGAVAAGMGVGSVACGLLAGGLLLVSLANFLLPIHYMLTNDGVSVRGIGEASLIKWSRIDAARVRQNQAVLLVTPDGQATPREFVLRYPANPAAAIDPLRARLLDAGAPLV